MTSVDFDIPTSDSGNGEKRTIFRHILTGSFLFILATFVCFLYLGYRRPVFYSVRHMQWLSAPKGEHVDIAILITSEFRNVRERQTIRKTWLNAEDKNLSFKIIHYFVFGYLDMTNKSEWDALQKEDEYYGDILTLPTFDDTSKLTWKVSEVFTWFYDVGVLEYGFQYLLKCDDRTYVRVDKLTEALKQIEVAYTRPYGERMINNSGIYHNVDIQGGADNEEIGLYWGYFSGKSSSGDEHNVFDCNNLNPFAYGGGYVLSTTLIGFLANNKNYLRHYHSEDVSVGAWLAPINNIVRIHDRRFDTEYVSRGCQNYYLVRHNISPEEMRIMYANLKEKQQLCTEETRTRKEYIYDWSVPPSKCCDRAIE